MAGHGFVTDAAPGPIPPGPIAPGPTPDATRRDFLFVATGAFAAVGGIFAVWPFIDQMEPAADVIAAGAPLTVDVSKIPPGQQIVVIWRAKPIFIVHRTPALIAELRKPAALSLLRDPDSKEDQQPAYAANWSRSLKPEFLVAVGICTHLGCIPTFVPTIGDPTLGADWPGGYLCHCHGSRYDSAGRVFKNVPAPLNLPVPPYHFVGGTKLVIGENPTGQKFDISSVEQL